MAGLIAPKLLRLVRSEGGRRSRLDRALRGQRVLSFRARIHRLELLAALLAVVVVEALAVDTTLLWRTGTGTRTCGTKRTRGTCGTLSPPSATAPAASSATGRAVTLAGNAG